MTPGHLEGAHSRNLPRRFKRRRVAETLISLERKIFIESSRVRSIQARGNCVHDMVTLGGGRVMNNRAVRSSDHAREITVTFCGARQCRVRLTRRFQPGWGNTAAFSWHIFPGMDFSR